MYLAQRRVPRRGGVTVWVVVGLALILGITAIGMDGGRMMDERRRAQAAADAAALAAAIDLFNNYSTNGGSDPNGTGKQAALDSARTNGYANDGTASVVTVNIPPKSGPFNGKTDHAEVIIQTNLTAGFSAVFNRGSLPVQARAVCRGRPQKSNILLLGSGPNALQLTGNASIQANTESILLDSTSSGALSVGSNNTVKAASLQLAGSYSGPTGNLVGTLNTNVAPTPDPLRTFPAPALTDYTVQSSSTDYLSGGTVSLQPGVYTGGINISGGTVTLQPGVYLMNGGGFTITGGNTTGNGVMIYNTAGAGAGAVSLSGNGTINLSAPTSGTYTGIVIFQDRSLSTTLSFSGGGTLNVGGTVYAPAANVSMAGNGAINFSPSGAFVVASMALTGTAAVTVTPGTNRPRNPEIRLVE